MFSFSFQNNSKIWICLIRRIELVLTAKTPRIDLIIYSRSRKGKTPSYSQIYGDDDDDDVGTSKPRCMCQSKVVPVAFYQGHKQHSAMFMHKFHLPSFEQ